MRSVRGRNVSAARLSHLLPPTNDGVRRHALATVTNARTRRRRKACTRRRYAARGGDADASYGRRRRGRRVAAGPVGQVGAARRVHESDWAAPGIVRRGTVGWRAAVGVDAGLCCGARLGSAGESGICVRAVRGRRIRGIGDGGIRRGQRLIATHGLVAHEHVAADHPNVARRATTATAWTLARFAANRSECAPAHPRTRLGLRRFHLGVARTIGAPRIGDGGIPSGLGRDGARAASG
jgi:hypothetical protein